jgi:hypothetical protein
MCILATYRSPTDNIQDSETENAMNKLITLLDSRLLSMLMKHTTWPLQT